MKLLKLSAMACGILLFAACSKTDDNNPNPGPTNTAALIVDGTWQWSDLDFVLNMGGTDTLINAWHEVDSCDRDDIMTFTADGNGQIDEMATKCNPADPQIETLTWELLNNDTQVKVTTATDTSILTIMELTATKAVYRSKVFTGTDSITVQQTFTNID
jgi:hypothetical protein